MKNHVSAAAALLLSMSLMTAPGAAEASGRIDQLISAMPLRDKIMQMMMLEIRYWDEELPLDEKGKTISDKQTPFTVMNAQVQALLEKYRPGAVICFAQNLVGTQQSFELTQALQAAAMKNGGIPLLIAADQEGGSVFRLNSGTALPGNMALGAAGSLEFARQAGRILGSELDAIGINVNLAPVVDVNNNANNPVIGLRSFGDDPEAVGRMASAVIAGMAEYNVTGCAKHFPGHGDTMTDSHYGLPCVEKSEELLRACELRPFEIAVRQDVDMIMTAHILYPQLEKDTVFSAKTGRNEQLPATMSDAIITGLLKEEMGFEGVVITDAMNMASIADVWTSDQAVINAILAGADMICMPCRLMCPADAEELERIACAVEKAVSDGIIPRSRIDDALQRILTVKEKHGVLDLTSSSKQLNAALAAVGSDVNRARERQIASAAVTVVQNKNSALPLRLTGESKVLMMVPYENELAQMIMGWNRAQEAGLIPSGAQVRTVRFHSGSTIDSVRDDLNWADTIIFNSEISRAAQMNGGSWQSAFILSAIQCAEAANKITIVQSVDKPYDVQSYPGADAVLAVYGCRGSSLDPTEALTGRVLSAQDACGPNITAGVEAMLGVTGAKGCLPVNIPVFRDGGFCSETAFERGFSLPYESLLNQ